MTEHAEHGAGGDGGAAPSPFKARRLGCATGAHVLTTETRLAAMSCMDLCGACHPSCGYIPCRGSTVTSTVIAEEAAIGLISRLEFMCPVADRAVCSTFLGIVMMRGLTEVHVALPKTCGKAAPLLPRMLGFLPALSILHVATGGLFERDETARVFLTGVGALSQLVDLGLDLQMVPVRINADANCTFANPCNSQRISSTGRHAATEAGCSGGAVWLEPTDAERAGMRALMHLSRLTRLALSVENPRKEWAAHLFWIITGMPWLVAVGVAQVGTCFELLVEDSQRNEVVCGSVGLHLCRSTRMPRLRSLDACGTMSADHGLGPGSGVQTFAHGVPGHRRSRMVVRQLTHLDASSNCITPACGGLLAMMQGNLRSLNISGNVKRLKDVSRGLHRMPALTSLDISGSFYIFNDLQNFLYTLRTFESSGLPVGQKAPVSGNAGTQGLRRLVIANIGGLWKQHAKTFARQLARLQLLEELVLYASGVRHGGVDALQAFRKMPALRMLDISDADRASSGGLSNECVGLIRKMTRLTRLEVSNRRMWRSINTLNAHDMETEADYERGMGMEEDVLGAAAPWMKVVGFSSWKRQQRF